MPSDKDLLFGKLVLQKGFCTQGQIDWCLSLQAASKGAPLGKMLLAQGYLTEAQHSEILAIQEMHLRALDPVQKKQKEATLFGKLALREGLLTEDEINECLREQARDGEKRSLGEIMIEKGYLTSRQVQELLAKQQKKILKCLGCALSYTVLSISNDKKEILCPKCKRPLSEGDPAGPIRTDAEFATQVLRFTKSELRPRAEADSRVIPPGAPSLDVTCIICTHRFQGALDSTGRVRCPECRTTFVPK